MAGMKRFVTYIYSYENREKGNNIGFARIEIRGEECRLEVHLRGLPGNTNGKAALFHVTEAGKMQGFPVGEFVVAGGSADFRVLFRSERLGESPYSIYNMEGIIFFCEDERIFMSRWSEGEAVTVDKEHYEVWKKPVDGTGREKDAGQPEQGADGQQPGVYRQPVQPVNGQQTAETQQMAGEQKTGEAGQGTGGQKTEERKDVPEGKEGEKAERMTDAFQENVTATEIPMQNIFPQYTWGDIWENLKKDHAMDMPFEEEGIACLRIELKDIRNLPRRYWYLGNNSFLLHGFFNYHYLIIGRKGEHYFLGIPGIFQRQERVMAAIFGFPEFLPVALHFGAEKENQQDAEPLNRFGFWFRYMEE